MTRFPPEIEFLLNCLRRAVLDPESAASVPTNPQLAPPAGLDWRLLLTLAEEHRILGIVYPQLAPYAPEEFAAAWRVAWVHSLLLVSELESSLDAFSRDGIDVLPLKGPVLAEALYGNVSARQSVDLDLLVRPRDFAAAESLLLASGFRADPHPGSEYHLGFVRQGTKIELHTQFGLQGHCPLDTDGIWRRSVAASFQQRPMRAIAEEDLILFLSYHLLKHNCSRLIWTADLGRSLVLLEKMSAGESLLAAAHAQAMGGLLLVACAVVAHTLKTPLPAKIAAALARQPKLAREARAFLQLRLGGPSGALICPYSWIAPQHFGSGLKRVWRRLTLFLAPTSRDRAWAESRRIPHPLLLPLLPALRLFRLLQKYGAGRAWKIMAFRLRG